MDNKITKKRLTGLFSYEWIKMIVFFLLAVLVFELLFAVTGVKLTSGQQFKVIYDEHVDDDLDNDLISAVCLDSQNRSLFSYEVQKVDAEIMGKSNQNVIDVRYQVRDSDVVITVDREISYSEKNLNRAKELIDYFEVWSFEDAVIDAEGYLANFLKEGETDVYDYDNLDQGKIDAHFLQTHQKDNRFRNGKNLQKGYESERTRIKNLVSDLNDIAYLLQNQPQLFMRYTRYEQLVKTMDKTEDSYAGYVAKYQTEVEKSYAIKLDGLTQGKRRIADYVTSSGSTKDVVIFAYDFYFEQPDLQFESLRFMTLLVRNFSNFLDN